MAMVEAGFKEVPEDEAEGAPKDEARIVYDDEADTFSIVAETTIPAKGLKFEPSEVIPWKPGTALDGGFLTPKYMELAIRMIEPDVIESPLATSNAWCLSVSWNIAVEALGRISHRYSDDGQFISSPLTKALIPTIRGAIAKSPTYKALRKAEDKNREEGGGDDAVPFFFFEPFRLPDPTTHPRREWLYGGHYLRKALSATIAPGGFGKSTLGLIEAVSMATGKALLGHEPRKQFRVLVWNGEETREELARRVGGICLKHGIANDELGGRLMLASGRDAGLDIKIARAAGNKVEIVESAVEMLTRALKRSGADAVILDPLVSVHDAPENDNTAMQVVVTAMRRVAEGANCAIELVHHTRKVGDNRVKVDDSRGGSALMSGTRSMRTLNRMTRDEARDWSVPDRERASLICIDGGGKANYAPSGAPVSWFRIESVGLGNAGKLLEPQDHVGVPVPWTPPATANEEEIELDFETARPALAGCDWRSDSRSPDWIGHTLAERLGLDVKNDAGAKKQIERLISRWIKEKHLTEGVGKDKHKRPVPVLRVAGEPIKGEESA